MKISGNLKHPLIIHSCTSLSFSGLERYVLELVSWQVAQGENVELFCREGSELCKQAQNSGVSVWTIPRDMKVGPRMWWHLRRQWALRHMRQDQKPVLHLPRAGELKIHRPWLNSRNFSNIILQYHLWITHKKMNLYHRFLYGGLRQIWCSSESARHQLRELIPVCPKMFHVVPYGRNTDELQAIDRNYCRNRFRRQWNIPADAMIALTVARFEKIKGIYEAVLGFIAAASSHSHIHFVLVGGPSPQDQEARLYFQQLQQLVEGAPPSVKGRIHFLGFQEGVEKIMAACDFYILPSYEECMSLALLDALILGLPAIATDAGGTPSVVQNERSGLLVTVKDSDSIKNAILRMISDEQGRKQWSLGAAEIAKDHDKKKIFESILGLYFCEGRSI